MALYPRSRVLYQPSATPDVIVRVFSCVERGILLDGLLPLLLVALQRFRNLRKQFTDITIYHERNGYREQRCI